MTRPRILRLLFIAIFALSLLGNAAAFGIYLRFKQVSETLSDGPRLVAQLPAAKRAKVISNLRDIRGELTTAMEILGEARKKMFAIAQERPFDRAKTEAAMAEVRKASEALQIMGQRALIDALSQDD
jgi:uncharacterized membrane protein